MSAWTDHPELDAQLLDLYEKRLNLTEIARRLGNGLTRDDVRNRLDYPHKALTWTPEEIEILKANPGVLPSELAATKLLRRSAQQINGKRSKLHKAGKLEAVRLHRGPEPKLAKKVAKGKGAGKPKSAAAKPKVESRKPSPRLGSVVMQSPVAPADSARDDRLSWLDETIIFTPDIWPVCGRQAEPASDELLQQCALACKARAAETAPLEAAA